METVKNSEGRMELETRDREKNKQKNKQINNNLVILNSIMDLIRVYNLFILACVHWPQSYVCMYH